MDLDLGSHVRSSDGVEVGRVDRIIFEPDTLKVREFVVHKGFLLGDDRIVSIRHVERTDDEHTVHLDIPASGVRNLPPFITEEHIPVFSGDMDRVNTPSYVVTHQGSVPRDAVVLSHRSEVRDSEGKRLGHLDEVLYNEDGCAAGFIVDSGRIFTHDVQVPLSAVRRITRERIDLNIRADDCELARR